MKNSIMNLFIIFVFFEIFCFGGSSKILGIFNVPAGSHYMLASRLFTEIAKRGHDVTFITPFSQKEPTENLKEVELESLRTVFTNFASMYEQAKVTPLEKAININKILLQVTNHTISHPKIQDLINSNEQYDAVILYYYLNDALLALAHHFKAPVILFAPTPLYASQSFLLSHPAPSSYVPNMLAEYTGRMNFWQRLKNSFYDVSMILYYQWFMLPKHRDLAQKYIPGQSKFYDILNNESLVLVNTHLSINEAVPVVPNVIEIGGYHFEEVKPLPEDLQKFLDRSKNGVVLFSMGSILKSADLPREKRDALIGAFSKLKQNVLWKFEENLLNLPKNVKIMKWIPQFDLLAHPNIKGFINHGGLLSVMESVYHGVPIIGIPIMADHKMNMALAAANGYGIELQYQALTEEKILQALDQILNDTKYRDDVQRRSKIMRDRPVKPLENALYWIEYVIRHQGAPHFRYPGMDLNWFQRNLLDIAACIISLTILTFITLVVCLKRYCKSVKQKKE